MVTLDLPRVQHQLERERIRQEFAAAARQAEEATATLARAADDHGRVVVLAVARYSAVGDTELSFDIGDTIEVLKCDVSGWWEGVCRGRVGWFPSNFCKVRSVCRTPAPPTAHVCPPARR